MSPRAGWWLALLIPLSAAAEAPESLLLCREIAGDAERLACYDRVVDRARAQLEPEAAQAASGPATEPRRTDPQTAASAGGSEAPSAPAAAVAATAVRAEERSRSLGERWFGRSDSEDDRALRDLYGVSEVEELEAEVAAISKMPDRALEITLVNGQRWRQKEAVTFPLRVGDRVEIEKGALGAYYMRRESGGPRIAVKRTN